MFAKRIRGRRGLAFCIVAACLGWLLAGGVALAGTIDEPEPDKPVSEELQPPPHPPEGEPGDAPARRRGFRGRGDRDRHPGNRLWRRFSEEERRDLIEFMAEHFPERFDEIADAETEDTELFSRYAGRMLPQMMRLRELKEEDPEAFEVQVETMKKEFRLRRLARRYRFASTDEDKAKLEQEIRTLVSELFDLKGRHETLELARLEKRLDHLRERIEQREADRDKHVDRMVADILSGKPPRDKRGRRGEGEGDRARFNAVPESTSPEGESPNQERRLKRGPRDRRDD